MTKAEVAEYLRVSTKTVWRLSKAYLDGDPNGLPCLLVGRVGHRWDRQEIDTWLQRERQSAPKQATLSSLSGRVDKR